MDFALLAQLEFLEDRLVAVGSRPLQVVEETPPCGDEFEQPATGRMVLRVGFEMPGELVDSFGQKRDLNVRAACVFFVESKDVDLCLCCLCHFVYFLCKGDRIPRRAADGKGEIFHNLQVDLTGREFTCGIVPVTGSLFYVGRPTLVSQRIK